MKIRPVYSSKQNGFTLVELAIVMVIIGLLISGILKGQALVESARIKSTITQIKSYKGAFYTFKDKYKAIAGDMLDATTRIPGCNAANSCVNGDGNTVIGRVPNAGQDLSQINQAGLASAPQVETSMFWKHLALANLITGVAGDADPTAPEWGKTHPANAFTGGYQIFFSISSGDFGTGHVIRLQRNIIGSNALNVTGQMPLTPAVAYEIDRKLDDGDPDQGSVTSDFAGTECDRGGRYQTEEDNYNCTLYYQLDR